MRLPGNTLNRTFRPYATQRLRRKWFAGSRLAAQSSGDPATAANLIVGSLPKFFSARHLCRRSTLLEVKLERGVYPEACPGVRLRTACRPEDSETVTTCHLTRCPVCHRGRACFPRVSDQPTWSLPGRRQGAVGRGLRREGKGRCREAISAGGEVVREDAAIPRAVGLAPAGPDARAGLASRRCEQSRTGLTPHFLGKGSPFIRTGPA
jgi:hypothetical protein